MCFVLYNIQLSIICANQIISVPPPSNEWHKIPENLIVRIFAVLDRRVGKRRLALMKETIAEEPDTFQEFYAIRLKAEGLI